MSNLELLKLELLKLELERANLRSQAARRTELRSLERRARTRITCGIIRLALLVGLMAISLAVLWRI